MSYKKRFVKLLMSFGFLLLTFDIHAENSGAQLADRMLERLGGRVAWAGLKNTVNGSMQYRTEEPFEVYSIITMDFTQPRFRIDTIASDINLNRVINGSKSWRISWSGKVEDLPEESYKREMEWYQAHVYRTIHRIAKNDPELSLKKAGDNQLEVFVDDTRLIWFRLTKDGEPFAFGFRDDNAGSITGPWAITKNGISHPAWVSSRDGTWRASIRLLEINVPLHSNIFKRP